MWHEFLFKERIGGSQVKNHLLHRYYVLNSASWDIPSYFYSSISSQRVSPNAFSAATSESIIKLSHLLLITNTSSSSLKSSSIPHTVSISSSPFPLIFVPLFPLHNKLGWHLIPKTESLATKKLFSLLFVVIRIYLIFQTLLRMRENNYK